MRYEKLEHLLDLALDMRLSRVGVSIQDIQNKYSVSRRTAIRMKDLILNMFITILRINKKTLKTFYLINFLFQE